MSKKKEKRLRNQVLPEYLHGIEMTMSAAKGMDDLPTFVGILRANTSALLNSLHTAFMQAMQKVESIKAVTATHHLPKKNCHGFVIFLMWERLVLGEIERG